MRYLPDTFVISEAWKREPHPGVLQWIEQQNEQGLFLSSLTIGELAKGIGRMPGDARRDRLRARATEILPVRFEGRILSIDSGVAARRGAMLAEAEKNVDALPAVDSLIAATAAFHGLTVVTRNNEGFRRCRMPVFSPSTGVGFP